MAHFSNLLRDLNITLKFSDFSTTQSVVLKTLTYEEESKIHHYNVVGYVLPLRMYFEPMPQFDYMGAFKQVEEIALYLVKNNFYVKDWVEVLNEEGEYDYYLSLVIAYPTKVENKRNIYIGGGRKSS